MRTTIRTKIQTNSIFLHKPAIVANKILELDGRPFVKAKYHNLAADIVLTVQNHTNDQLEIAEIASCYLVKLGYELAKSDVDIYRKK